jgi:hypothetical protein
MAPVPAAWTRIAEKAQVRRQKRQDRDELRSTYQQSFW